MSEATQSDGFWKEAWDHYFRIRQLKRSEMEDEVRSSQPGEAKYLAASRAIDEIEMFHMLGPGDTYQIMMWRAMHVEEHRKWVRDNPAPGGSKGQ